MLNKFFKTIHNKYSRFFKFIFFIRYLIAIFVISLALFLSIPNFFNYERKAEFIKNHLSNNYKFRIIKLEKIKYSAFPFPNLELRNVQVQVENIKTNLNIKKLIIYPNLISIYNFQNFQTNKLILKDNKIVLEASNISPFMKILLEQKSKLFLSNLDLSITNKNKFIINLENIKFANYGYNKNLIQGKIFDKKFKISIDDNFKNINFKLIRSGINAFVNFDINQNQDFKSGVFGAKILNTKLKLYFDYNNKDLKLYNSYFRSKNLSFNNNTLITLNPFLNIDSKFEIEEFETDLLKDLNLIKLLEKKDILKKININNEINFKSKKFTKNLIDNLNLKIDLAYGRINYVKKFSFADNFFHCQGNINLLEKYPLLFFDCYITAKDKQKFLNFFSIKTKKERDKTLEINASGSLNILSQKINFKSISVDNDYNGSKEDLLYFKNTFEKIIFDGNLIDIFDKKKIKEFIQELS